MESKKKPPRKFLTKRQVFNLLDSAFEAWAVGGIEADFLDLASAWRDVGCSEWVSEWIVLNRFRNAA